MNDEKEITIGRGSHMVKVQRLRKAAGKGHGDSSSNAGGGDLSRRNLSNATLGRDFQYSVERKSTITKGVSFVPGQRESDTITVQPGESLGSPKDNKPSGRLMITKTVQSMKLGDDIAELLCKDFADVELY